MPNTSLPIIIGVTRVANEETLYEIVQTYEAISWEG